jgi:hypothetical protein
MKVISVYGRRWSMGLLVVLAAICFSNPSRLCGQSADDVTVGYLFNFARFIEWPPAAFPGNSAPFTIGIIGRPALADTFAKNVAGRKVSGRDLVVKRVEAGAGIENCQIVFVGDPGQAASILTALKGKPVLTVADGEGFLNTGGMIAFVRDGARLVFDLNLSAIKAGHLTPDPKVEKAAHATKSP